MPPRRLEIAPTVLRELNDVLEYTEETWGLEQALDYSAAFDSLCSFPELGRERSELAEGLRCMVAREHLVIYRVLPSLIQITRIVHESKDPNFSVDPEE